MTVTIERVFELTDNDIEYLAKKWQCQFDEVKEIIESGDFDIDDLHFIATNTYHDYSTIMVK
jgi:hypothetical protein